MKLDYPYEEIAGDQALWREYIDIEGYHTQSTFDGTTTDLCHCDRGTRLVATPKAVTEECESCGATRIIRFKARLPNK